MSNTIAPNKDTHANSIVQTMYDGSVGAGYVKFCDCPVGRTTDLTQTTKYRFLYDVDEKIDHVVGLEILHFPVQGMSSSNLSADLALTELSNVQKQAVMNRFLKKS